MNLPRDGREWVTWPMTGAPEGATFEALFTNAATEDPSWQAVVETVDAATIRVLVAGPDAPAGAGVTLPLGRSLVRFRMAEDPEAVVRGGGVIDVR